MLTPLDVRMYNHNVHGKQTNFPMANTCNEKGFNYEQGIKRKKREYRKALKQQRRFWAIR